VRYKAVFLFILILFLPAILHAWEGKVVGATDGARGCRDLEVTRLQSNDLQPEEHYGK